VLTASKLTLKHFLLGNYINKDLRNKKYILCQHSDFLLLKLKDVTQGVA